ncbi:MAG TPA: T9SS type A sorting domain-containing protein [Flavobacteriaceae bacterium]|nr:T9SS type A sorting domain-containing protein [Flavobacteriaceae bacterium]
MNTINLSYLSKGMYFLKLNNEKGNSITKKIVLE